MPLVRRLVPIAVAAAIVGAAVVGAAASLPLASDHLAAGNAVVARCDTGGVSVAYVGAPGNVTALAVTQLDAACDGGAIKATVTDLAGGNVASGSAVVSSGSATIPLSPARPAEVVRRWRIVVVTP
jgi:hypothetical protein